jgi:hypothetical protein
MDAPPPEEVLLLLLKAVDALDPTVSNKGKGSEKA